MHSHGQDGARASGAAASEAVPAPSGPPDVPAGADGSTGDAAVDEAVGRLDELDGLPVREHVGVFEAVQASLQDRLADVED